MKCKKLKWALSEFDKYTCVIQPLSKYRAAPQRVPSCLSLNLCLTLPEVTAVLFFPLLHFSFVGFRI